MEEIRKSRTQMKNQDKQLQQLGEQLAAVSPEALERLDISEELLEAVRLVWEIKSHGAKRRQMKHIGGLMRNMDTESLERLLNDFRRRDTHKALAFKRIETWRDELKAGNIALVEEILASCPAGERNHLIHLSLNAQKECAAEGKGGKASRTLFRYLRQITGSEL